MTTKIRHELVATTPQVHIHFHWVSLNGEGHTETHIFESWLRNHPTADEIIKIGNMSGKPEYMMRDLQKPHILHIHINV
jgi:hypothetical protein